jgi:hypothetical protein
MKGLRNLPRERRAAFQNAKRIPIVNRLGIYTGDTAAVRGQPEMEIAIRWIVRGLFYEMTQKPFPANHAIRVSNDTRFIDSLAKMVSKSGAPSTGAFGVGHNVFAFECYYVPGKPEIAAWFLAFYEGVFMCAVTAREQEPQAVRAHIILP